MAKTNWHHIDVSILDFEDKKTWELIARGDTDGVFQLSSSGMKELCKELDPDCMEHLIGILALYRPDTMSEIKHFIKRRHGREVVTFIHPDLEPILGDTFGCLIYQEQFMQIAQKFANYSDGEADRLRKGLGKKDKALVRDEAEKFYNRALENKYPEKVCRELADTFMEKGGYCFNKGHSTGYAITSYKTAYLKANYPLEFMSSILNNQKKESGQTDYESLGKFMAKCKEMGIYVTSPDLNTSGKKFRPVDGGIRYGLQLIKGLSATTINFIIEKRPFSSLDDFVQFGIADKTSVIALIKSGAFDFTGIERKQLLYDYQDIRFASKAEEIKPVKSVNKTHIEKMINLGLIDDVEALDKVFCTNIWNNYRQRVCKAQWEEKYMQGNEFNWEFETISTHMIGDPFEGIDFTSPEDINDGCQFKIGGTIIASKKTKIKRGKSKGQEMAFLQLQTSSDIVEIVVFTRQWNEYKEVLGKGQMIVATVQKDGEKYFLKTQISLEDFKLYHL